MTDKEKLIASLEERGIFCLMPNRWNKLFLLMEKKVESWCVENKREYQKPPLPCVLHGWYVSDEVKKDRFLTHIEWANEYSNLPLVERFLSESKETEFYYGEDGPSNPL